MEHSSRFNNNLPSWASLRCVKSIQLTSTLRSCSPQPVLAWPAFSLGAIDGLKAQTKIITSCKSPARSFASNEHDMRDSSYPPQESNFRLIISASNIHGFLSHSLCAKPSANRPVGYQLLQLQNPAMAGHKQLMHKTLLCYLIAAWMTSRFLTDMVIFKGGTLSHKPLTILFDTI